MKTKFIILTFILFTVTSNLKSQITSGKKTFKFNSTPELSIDSIKFMDQNLNQFADAGEKCFLLFNLKNSGKTVAKKVNVQLNTKDSVNAYFSFKKTFPIGDIQNGETKEIKIPMITATSFDDVNVTFELIAEEANNYNSNPILFNVAVKAVNESITINWYFPELPESMVNTTAYTIKACINSALPVTEVSISDNNIPYQNDRGFKLLKTENCDYYLEQEIKLEEGKNEIQIIAGNKKTIFESESRNLTYSEFANEKRVALVIGNSEYLTAPLRNPVNDATLMTKQLKKTRF
jgi:hypothetical protein